MAGLSLPAENTEEEMNDMGGDTCRLGPRKALPVHDETDSQRTVAALVDPATGMVLSRGVLGHEYQYDETVAISNPEPVGMNGGKQVVEFIPDNGRCGKRDQTVVWSTKAPLDPIRFVTKLVSYRNRLGKKGWVVVSVGLILLLITGMVGTICEAGKFDSERYTPTDAAREEAPVSLRAPPASHPEVSDKSTPSPVSVPSSKMAADALVEGRLDEALKRYHELKTHHPEKQPYALIVDILSASEKGRMP
jgi:hypothetical protein